MKPTEPTLIRFSVFTFPVLLFGRVVGVSDSQSGGPEFESHPDHYLDLFLGRPKFKSSATLVNSQPVCLLPVGILNNCYV